MNDQRSGPLDTTVPPSVHVQTADVSPRDTAAPIPNRFAGSMARQTASTLHGVTTSQRLTNLQAQLRMATEQLDTQMHATAGAGGALQRERQRCRELFDAALLPYLVTDFCGHVVNTNVCAAALFNIDANFLVGKPLGMFVHAEHRVELRDVLHDASLSGHIGSFEWRVARRRTHEPVWVVIDVSRVRSRDRAGDLLHWMFSVIAPPTIQEREARPIAPQPLASGTAALNRRFDAEHQARCEIERELRGRGDFLAATARELRSPLGSLAGWLNLIDGNYSDKPLRARAFASMRRSVYALTRMVEELVDKARPADGALMLEMDRVQLSEVVRKSVEELRPAARNKRVQLVASIDEQLPDMQADARRLQQVVDNLIANAIKFTPPSGKIVVLLVRCGDQAELSVSDTGRGVAPDALTRIFDPFVQLGLEPAARSAGMGLGLYVARRLAELHGGTITAESRGEGHGSCLRVRLPLVTQTTISSA